MPSLDTDAGQYQVLTKHGEVRDGVEPPRIKDAELREMYREMRLARRLDTRLISLQRQGRMGTYASLAGQEGSQIASTHALRDDDWILYQYREHGAVIARGLSHEYLHYWMGYEEGNEWLGDRRVFPLNIGIGSHIPHATGMGWAAKLKGDDAVVCCHFGDGATSEGDFHEALNFAGVFDTPNVFFCNNNQWAISVPRDRQTASETIAQKADAYGFEGVQVDGMDPLAVYEVTRDAVEKARNSRGSDRRPTLIEAVQYRFGAHTTADDPSAYRDEEELERWKEFDPLPRFETYLRNHGLLDDEAVDAIEAAVEDEVEDLVASAESTAEREPDAMFESAYETLSDEVVRQRDWLRTLRARHGDDAILESE